MKIRKERRVCDCGRSFVAAINRDRRLCGPCQQSRGKYNLQFQPVRCVPEYADLNMGNPWPALSAINCPVL